MILKMKLQRISKLAMARRGGNLQAMLGRKLLLMKARKKRMALLQILLRQTEHHVTLPRHSGKVTIPHRFHHLPTKKKSSSMKRTYPVRRDFRVNSYPFKTDNQLMLNRARTVFFLRNMLRRRYLKLFRGVGLRVSRFQKLSIAKSITNYIAMKFFLRHRARSTRLLLSKTVNRSLPILRISRTLHNIFFNVLNVDHKIIYTSSLYALAPKTEKNKQSPESLAAVAAAIAVQFRLLGARSILIQLYSRTNSRIMGFLRSLTVEQKVNFSIIQDLARGPHNGLRPKKSRNQRR